MKNRNLIVAAGVAVVLVALLLVNVRIFQPGEAAKATNTEQTKAEPLPAVFPKDFPIYPGATYLGADNDQGQINGRSWDRGWFETRDEGPKVIEWYDAHLEQAGYPPVKSNKNGTDKQFSFAPGKEIIQMEVFTETNKPTTISVDFYTAP
jgi:hypothetical protein